MNQNTQGHPALGFLATSLYLMTASFEGKRAGVVVTSVQVCLGDQPLVCVAMRKGHWIEPLIRDSRAFAIHVIDPADRLVTRKFGDALRVREPGDPFDPFPVERLATGAPIIKRCLAAVDCEVSRHIDVEAEHALYIGVVRASRVYTTDTARAAAAQATVDSVAGLVLPTAVR